MVAGRTAPDTTELDLLAKAYNYALEDVPTHHLEQCFKIALYNKRDNFPVSGIEMRLAWLGYKDELRARAAEHAAEMERELMFGKGSLDYISLDEFKRRHNLPPQWRLGDAYPPESDLYSKPLPPREPEQFKCARCKDAGWLVDRTHRLKPKMVRCPSCTVVEA